MFNLVLIFGSFLLAVHKLYKLQTVPSQHLKIKSLIERNKDWVMIKVDNTYEIVIF